MSGSLQTWCAGISAAVLGTVMAAGMLDLQAASSTLASYGGQLAEIAVRERNALNTVSAVLFDLRALDTLGELLALFTASAGLHVVLRPLAEERERESSRAARPGRPAAPTSDAVHASCLALAIPTAMLGVYITVRGHLTIGGGFQGGVLICAALFLLYLSGRLKLQETMANETGLDLAESLSMGGYVVVGLAGLLTAGAFLTNILPLGTPGTLLSAGSIPLLSLLVAIDAAAATALAISHVQNEPLDRVGGP